MKSLGVVLVFLLVAIVACTKAAPAGPEPTAAKATPLASVGPAPGVTAAPPDDVSTAKAWNDPSAVAQLEANCRWEPAKAGTEGAPSSPLACALEFEQSCVPDPCFDEDQETCKPACLKGCETCSADCAGACETCKSACKDAVCKHTCAVSCATCRDGCVRAHDRCKSGTCGKAFDACHSKMAGEWKKGNCTAACVTFMRCYEGCSAKADDQDKCTDRCRARFDPKCPKKFTSMCLFGARPNGAD